MEPAESPLAKSLDEFAQKLPSEHRSKLYEFAESFLAVGGMHGAFAGFASALGTTSKGDQQDDWNAYLSRKAEEYKQ